MRAPITSETFYLRVLQRILHPGQLLLDVRSTFRKGRLVASLGVQVLVARDANARADQHEQEDDHEDGGPGVHDLCGLVLVLVLVLLLLLLLLVLLVALLLCLLSILRSALLRLTLGRSSCRSIAFSPNSRESIADGRRPSHCLATGCIGCIGCTGCTGCTCVCIGLGQGLVAHIEIEVQRKEHRGPLVVGRSVAHFVSLGHG
mmetsp:Transcript_13370/g.28405  ORF Transcript_13370/g.28405 Transcript_13370/m.28405 type:complete len:203 (+) Transcript_13370:237-845(+)